MDYYVKLYNTYFCFKKDSEGKKEIVDKMDDAPLSILVLSSSMPKTPTSNKRKLRSKWHFGIRSRSPPLEVMLEIYRALKNLGMVIILRYLDNLR